MNKLNSDAIRRSQVTTEDKPVATDAEVDIEEVDLLEYD